MSIVKIGNKQALEQLQAKITLRLGRRLIQQEVIDLCIRLGTSNLDDLIRLIEDVPVINDDKVKRILKNKYALKDVPYIVNSDVLSEDDKDVYEL